MRTTSLRVKQLAAQAMLGTCRAQQQLNLCPVCRRTSPFCHSLRLNFPRRDHTDLPSTLAPSTAWPTSPSCDRFSATESDSRFILNKRCSRRNNTPRLLPRRRRLSADEDASDNSIAVTSPPRRLTFSSPVAPHVVPASARQFMPDTVVEAVLDFLPVQQALEIITR